MPTTYNLPTGRHSKDWNIEMRVTIDESSLTFTEYLTHNILTDKDIESRTLTITDIPAFERAADITKDNIREFLDKKNDKELLNIDHLLRLCERHEVEYTVAGDRLSTAHRNYIKLLRESENDCIDKGSVLYSKAKRRIHGLTPGTPIDHQKAESLLKEAIALDFYPAFAQLAKLYGIQGDFAKAVETAEKGVALDNPESMIKLAQMLSDPRIGGDTVDYKRVVKLLMTASRKGCSYQAAKCLHGLISKGLYYPKQDEFFKLIGLAARKDKQHEASVLAAKGFNAELLEIRKRLFGGDPDVPEIIEKLSETVNEGNPQAFGLLTVCYILQKRWGKAAETALKGAELNNRSSMMYATRLALMGADFTGKTDRLGAPDYEGTLKWCKRCIDEDILYGFQMLYHLAEIGQLKMEDLASPELVERCFHYVCLIPETQRADIYSAPFDGERYIKRKIEK